MKLLLLGLMMSSCAWASQLTMTDAILMALKQSPANDSAQKALALSELQFKNARAKFLPSVDFTTSDGLQNNVPISSNSNLLLAANPTAPWYSTLTLGLSETLYDNGVSITNLEIADLTRELARVNALKERDSLTLSVATEFYNYSLTSILLKVKRQQQAMLNKQYEIISSQYQQGFKIRADYLRIKTQVQQAEIDCITAQNTIDQSAAHLRQLMGINNRQPPTEAVTFVPVAVDNHQMFRELQDKTGPNLDEFYDSRAVRIQKDINDRNVNLAWRNYYPQVGVTSGVAYNNQNYINSQAAFPAGDQLSWELLATVQYNLWDWGTQRRNVEIAQVNRDTQADTLDLGLQKDYATAEQMMADIARVDRSYELSRQLMSEEDESNRLVESQYREGKVTYLDLITSLDNLLNAKVQFFTAYFNALQDIAELNYYKGHIYEALVEK